MGCQLAVEFWSCLPALWRFYRSGLAYKSATAPGGTTRTPQPVDSPFKPSPQAVQAINECSLSAAPGGCFSPEQVQTFYDLNPLYARGFRSEEHTIIIIDSFGSPTIKHDLQEI